MMIERGRDKELEEIFNAGNEEKETAGKCVIVYSFYWQMCRHDRQTASALGGVSFHLSMPRRQQRAN